MIDIISELSGRFPELIGYQHFDIPDEIAGFAIEQLVLANNEAGWPAVRDFNVPISACLPSPKMIISVKGYLFILTGGGPVGEAVVGVYHRPTRGFLTFGGILPGKPLIFDESELPEDYVSKLILLLIKVAFILSLINEPSVVKLRPGGTRQTRRAAKRRFGIPVDAWTRVSWDLSAETVARVRRDPTFRKVALHWRRGHFRRAEPHYQGAIQRPDAFRAEDRDLWWQWIDGRWVGHPAFGFRSSVHSPVMTAPTLAARKPLLSIAP